MKTKIILALIITLAAFLRFYKLTANPPGLYWDEAALGYNAYSILKTARDEYGSFLPFTFRSYDDYKNPVYFYLLVPSIAIFGLNELAIRFPSAFFGTLTVLLTYFLAKKILKNETISLLSTFFMAISAWHLQFSRAGFEANLMLFLDVLGVVLFLYSFKNYKLLILSAISFGLSFNTYHGAKVWVPLFLFCIGFIYKEEFFKFGKKILFPLLIMIIFVLPTILDYQIALTRGKNVSILSRPNAAEIFISGYLSHFSPTFLFISGDSQGRHSPTGEGELYVFQLPFIIIGLTSMIRKRNKGVSLLLSWLILSPLPAAIAAPTPHALRFITSLPLWSIFTAVGIFVLFKSDLNKTILKISAVIMLMITIYNVIFYLHVYYVHYPKEKGLDWQEGYRDMVQYVSSNQDKYDTVGITSYWGEPYIYALFYTKYDPKRYQSQVKGKLNSFDKYRFFEHGSDNFENSGKVLMVTTPDDGNKEKTLKIIYAHGEPVFRISEQ